MNELVSVIIPIYNVEQYIAVCIASVLNQTYTNLQIICIDDGSVDCSGKIADEWAAKDKRIIVKHQKNQGVSSARNSGLDIAMGAYITFVDPDDFISPVMYEKMIYLMKEKNLDMIECRHKRVIDNEMPKIEGTGTLQVALGKDVLLRDLRGQYSRTTIRIYKKKLWENLRYPKGRRYSEDVATVYRLYNQAQNVGSLDLTLYYYRKNLSSLTHNAFRIDYRWDTLLAYKERLEFAVINQLPCVDECKYQLVKATLSCLTAIYALSSNSNEKYIITIREILENNRGWRVYKQLDIKYKLYLMCFNRIDVVQHIGAKMSLLVKMIKDSAKAFYV